MSSWWKSQQRGRILLYIDVFGWNVTETNENCLCLSYPVVIVIQKDGFYFDCLQTIVAVLFALFHFPADFITTWNIKRTFYIASPLNFICMLTVKCIMHGFYSRQTNTNKLDQNLFTSIRHWPWISRFYNSIYIWIWCIFMCRTVSLNTIWLPSLSLCVHSIDAATLKSP